MTSYESTIHYVIKCGFSQQILLDILIDNHSIILVTPLREFHGISTSIPIDLILVYYRLQPLIYMQRT